MTALYLHNALCTVHTGEPMHCKPYFKDWQWYFSECLCVAATQFKYLPPIKRLSLFMGDTVMSVYMYHWTGLSLQWRHNGRDGVLTHRRFYCLFNRLLRCRSNETSKLPVTGLCEGKPPLTSSSPHKGPVTNMFQFDDVTTIIVSEHSQLCV